MEGRLRREQVRDAFKRRDHEEAVRLLRLQDPDVLHRYEADLLYYSICNGWLDVTRNLITNYHFDPLSKYNGRSYLFIAARGNHVDIINYLIKVCQVPGSYYDLSDVLHYVAEEGSLDVLKYVVKYLIEECNCNIMTRHQSGNTVLHDAASKGSLDVLKYLINTHHCNLMITNNSGQTILHRAVKHIDVVKYLVIECNCNVMATDTDKWTPLHYAVGWGTAEVVEYLLSTGNCDPLAKDKKGTTPLQLANKYNDTILAIFKKFGNIKISHPIDSYVNVLLVEMSKE
ncbi:PREDICTED: espin-like [Amphimedon queenslandica]|uniref:Uncharacterized protein n=1 Tax=Amphimedon queenslandica TaxID=400682 RepID=A0AAN0IYF9_AMPQE|nr:PREDICTED: espin-like [Amphimedon queenslandica]|eukprot:XP_019849587.1 PREDICTED: espin-like [Amphimedon queenslandica]